MSPILVRSFPFGLYIALLVLGVCCLTGHRTLKYTGAGGFVATLLRAQILAVGAFAESHSRLAGLALGKVLGLPAVAKEGDTFRPNVSYAHYFDSNLFRLA